MERMECTPRTLTPEAALNILNSAEAPEMDIADRFLYGSGILCSVLMTLGYRDLVHAYDAFIQHNLTPQEEPDT